MTINGVVPSPPILNACLNGTSTNLVPQLAQMMLPPTLAGAPSRYAYLNADFGNTIVPENAWTDEQLKFLVDAATGVSLADALLVLQNYWP